MKILAIETSCDTLSVSLLEENQLILELKESSPKSHSETLMPLLDTLFKKTQTTLDDISLFACDNGPGSFTGIRIGLSTVKAFCDITKKPCISVSSLEALAYTIFEENTVICSMIDAKHGNIYGAAFECKSKKYERIVDYTFSSLQDFLLSLGSLKKKIFFVGNCGILYKDMIKSYLKNEIVFSEDSIVSSENVGIAAFDKYTNGISQNSFELNAMYLKKSSAEEKNES